MSGLVGIRVLAILHFVLAPLPALCGYILCGFLMMVPSFIHHPNPQYFAPLHDLVAALLGACGESRPKRSLTGPIGAGA
jgi:hypothetical protein